MASSPPPSSLDPPLNSNAPSPSSPSTDLSPHPSSSSSSSSPGPSLSTTKCALCCDIPIKPRVLPCCLRSLCFPCLESLVNTAANADILPCPKCHTDIPLTTDGLLSFVPDYSAPNAFEAAVALGDITGRHTSPSTSTSQSLPTAQAQSPPLSFYCTSCKSEDSTAIARCLNCISYLCSNCVMAHQFMHCFEGHTVMALSEGGSSLSSKDSEPSPPPNGLMKSDRVVNCVRHKTEPLKFFCRSCNIPVCKECTVMEHPTGIHETENLGDVGSKLVEAMAHDLEEAKIRAAELRNTGKTIEHVSSKLQLQYQKAETEINETFVFYKTMLEERKNEVLKELQSGYSSKQHALTSLSAKVSDHIDKIYQTSDFMEKLLKHASNTEILMFKKIIDNKLMTAAQFSPEVSLQNNTDLEFVSNFQAIQVGVKNTFGYIRSSPDLQVGAKQPPIARPSNGIAGSINGFGGSPGNTSPMMPNGCPGSMLNGGNGTVQMDPHRSFGSGGRISPFDSISKRFNPSSMGPFMSDISLNGLSLNGSGSSGLSGHASGYEKWSSGTNGDSLYSSTGSDSGFDGSNVLDLGNKYIPSPSSGFFSSKIKRQKMIYHCKFGEFGVLEGQFTEPSGVAVNAQNDIIVADTNNHRIQIFDKEGRFKFQFGECGKRDGQLLYPNRVAVVRPSGDIVVTERSPTHQIQIYNQYGQFCRKFGANILQHPRGVTVDNKGRIIVVECKVMRVIIFDQMGNVLHKFGCSKHLEFPNGVVVNDRQEIFISDNRAHCVKVFNYEGQFLRQIGGEGLTNYPIGVGINAAGEIIVADNHNNFNMTVFTQDGQLLNALESKVKHAQCFDVALIDDGSVVLASKDYRLYIYRYSPVAPIIPQPSAICL
ncbi:unnamed protein product [Cyprideis torosa]|uniref:Uncharacterized protein n=1 Tax=Cyprideis torosa TaxID=163714 RepID=A0A7R8ZJF1_9CRUS|nr:unnamed protein product [Cyprideis torosa]CAG0879687.1 unnamed protein product [Cyprideis torosa]